MPFADIPTLEFVADDVSETLQNVLAVHTALTGRTLAEGDPERMLLQTLCALIVQQRALINETARLNFLRYARGTILDAMGDFADTPRLPSSAALTTIRFTLSAPQLSAIAIPIGTRTATATNPKRYFATAEYAEVLPGNTSVEVPAVATEAGGAANGYLPGEINQIVDPIPFVLSASNLTTSSGGADVEDDNAYRVRIREAPESFSVAGPEGAYRFWAKTANPAIIDVSVTSPAPTEVLVVPLLAGGEIPTSDVLDSVDAILNNRSIRPLTDQVTVAAPTTQNYTINLTYWIDSDKAPEASAIQAAVSQAITDYALWQRSKLGRPVNPSELVRRIMAAGAYRVNVTSPVYATVNPTVIAVLQGTPTVTYGGLTDD